jgi:hypothetical protein
MRSKSSLYWCCQLGGWLFYGLTMVFFAFIFENKTNDILYPRIAITILVGLHFYPFAARVDRKAQTPPPDPETEMVAAYRNRTQYHRAVNLSQQRRRGMAEDV